MGATHQAGGIRQPEFQRAGKTVSPTHKRTYNRFGILCEETRKERRKGPRMGTQGRAQEGMEEQEAQEGLEEEECSGEMTRIRQPEEPTQR